MIRAAIYGRIGGDPVSRTTRNGKPMATVSIAVDAGRPGEDSITEWVGLIAFGAVAELLAQHVKGDLISAMGSLTRSTFTGRDGQERSSWSLGAEVILSARTTAHESRPRRDAAHSAGPRRRPSYSSPSPARTPGPPLADDPLDDLFVRS
jgi:single-strand DNA-binding protein